MIDTHAHIDMNSYKNKIDKVLLSAKEHGVNQVIIPGVSSDGFGGIIELVDNYDELYGAVGVHPEDLESFNEDTPQKMFELLKHPKIVAVGEIGLDYYWDKSNVDLQKKVFAAQVQIAKKAKKPVLVHDREAHEDVFNILNEAKASETGVVMHCFSGSPEFALRCVKEGFYIALGGVTTFKNAKKAKEVAKIVPIERLLLETDSPYMAPVPFRGKENEPAFVRYVAEEIANLRGISLEEVDKATTENAYRLFPEMRENG